LTDLPTLVKCGSVLCAAHRHRRGKNLDISKVKAILKTLADYDNSFKLGLNVFLEGAQGLSGNHRILISAEDALEHLPNLERALMNLDQHWEFCLRSERPLILIYSSSDPYRAVESRPARHSPHPTEPHELVLCRCSSPMRHGSLVGVTIEGSGEWDISVCGLNCARCDIRQAGLGDERFRDEILEWFREELDTAVEPDKIRCGGCRGPPESHWSPDCKMMSCAMDRRHNYCFECGEFPCEKLEEFSRDGMAHHERTVENLNRMREMGLESWIEEQKSMGQCVFCP
jgi:hypothetical protein